ncbi:hypothetical protein [Chitinophaga vietnamensis]|uniref:hypothetical protein n=1 Tax=Chitinophaga vietnamensis TaxID=2593957 RepID=UPI00117762C7|nr:hypothetical protein [Chitinophaga vietnamensis]
MLVHELNKYPDKIEPANSGAIFLNERLGDTSFLLAGLLGSLLKEKYNEWHEQKWIDDSLITNVDTQNHQLIIEGVMIWGEMDTTEQWTSPFFFEIVLLADKAWFKKFTFLFCDLDKPEIAYEDFRDNRAYWVGRNRRWKYIINSNDTLI